MLESTTFCLKHHPTNLASRAARIMNELVNLSTVPTEYHKFANIFSKDKVENPGPTLFIQPTNQIRRWRKTTYQNDLLTFNYLTKSSQGIHQQKP